MDEYEKASRALVEGDAGPMTTFTNETLGEAWELKGEGADQHVLQARAEPYALHTVADGTAPAIPAPVSTPTAKPVRRVDDNLFAPISLQ